MGKLIDSDKVLSLIEQEQASCDITRWYDLRIYHSLENVRREVKKMQEECEKEIEEDNDERKEIRTDFRYLCN